MNRAVLTVSYGTASQASHKLTAGAIEQAVAEAFPDYEVRRAFISQTMIDKWNGQGLEIDSVAKALERAANDNVTTLAVQPTLLTRGDGYASLAAVIKEYADRFERIVLGEPLLFSDADFDAVVKVLTARMASYDDGKTAVCFMGHGTKAKPDRMFAAMQDKFKAAGYRNYYIAALKSYPSIADVISALNIAGIYQRVVLVPFMLAAGRHAHRDMAGDGGGSWKTLFEKEGYKTVCILEGLGQIPAIRDIYVAHARAALRK